MTIGISDINKSKKNVQMQIGERATFASVMQSNKTRLVLIRDEAHRNDTKNVADLIKMMRPYAIVDMTATAMKKQLEKAGGLHLVKVNHDDIVKSGKVRSQIIVNDAGMYDVDFDGDVTWEGTIKKSIHRRDWLEGEYRKVGMANTPLAVIQLPNDDTSDKNDTQQTVSNAMRAKQILLDQGVDKDDIIVWLAGQHDVDPREIKNTEHKFLIVKIACAEGWNCPRAQVFDKLRYPSQSDTLDDQTLGRFLRTTDPQEWIDNDDYRENEYLNSAFVYTANEDYDASLKGYSIRDEKYKQTVRDEYRDAISKIKLVKVVPGRHLIGVEKDIVDDMVSSFNEKFPYDYKNHGTWYVDKEDLTRRVAMGRFEVSRMIEDIEDKGKSLCAHGRANLEVETIEEYVFAKIKQSTRLRRYAETIRKAMNKHIMENLYDGPTFMGSPTAEGQQRLMKIRDDFLCGIYEFFSPDFENTCTKAIEAHVEYGNDVIHDGRDDEHQMFAPPESMFTGISLAETPDSSNFAYDKQGGKGTQPEEKMIASFMKPHMDVWFKNSTIDRDGFMIAYSDEYGARRKFFPDFISIKNRTLYIIETKGSADANGDHAIEPETDKCKAKAISDWLASKYKRQSLEACNDIDDIVFGIAKEINGNWRIYQGNGNTYQDFTSSDWKLLDTIVLS